MKGGVEYAGKDTTIIQPLNNSPAGLSAFTAAKIIEQKAQKIAQSPIEKPQTRPILSYTNAQEVLAGITYTKGVTSVEAAQHPKSDFIIDLRKQIVQLLSEIDKDTFKKDKPEDVLYFSAVVDNEQLISPADQIGIDAFFEIQGGTKQEYQSCAGGCR